MIGKIQGPWNNEDPESFVDKVLPWPTSFSCQKAGEEDLEYKTVGKFDYVT